jgi:hypothetical protein
MTSLIDQGIPIIESNETNESMKIDIIDSRINEFDSEDENIPVPIYRFKFTTEFTDELYKFSKIHQYDHRKDFKEAWNTWVEDNAELIADETRYLNENGYDGDILNKMFTSARYYLRKKNTEKKEPVERKKYICLNKDFLDIIDTYIKSNLDKPSQGFDNFCQTNIDVLKEEIRNLCSNGITNHTEIHKKIKKTYKNRYFLLTNK